MHLFYNSIWTNTIAYNHKNTTWNHEPVGIFVPLKTVMGRFWLHKLRSRSTTFYKVQVLVIFSCKVYCYDKSWILLMILLMLFSSIWRNHTGPSWRPWWTKGHRVEIEALYYHGYDFSRKVHRDQDCTVWLHL